MKKASKIGFALLVILLLVVIALGAFLFVKEKQNTDKRIGELENKISNSTEVDTQKDSNDSDASTSNNVTNNTSSNNETVTTNKNAVNNTEKKNENNASSLNVNGSYKFEQKTENYYHRSDIVVSNQTDSNIKFSINAAHGRDVDHVNIGDLKGTANKIEVPADSKVPESEQLAYEYKEEIDGKVNKVTFVFTAHREFQYVQVHEEYPDERNPYAGNNVYFEGEYEKIK